MSNIVKNLLIIFTLLCIIVLVVFCIELVILNVDKDNDNVEEPQLSDGLHIDTEDGKDKQEEANNGQSGETEQPDDVEQDGNDDQPDGQNQSPTLKEYKLRMLDNVHMLLLYADEELFDYSEGDVDWLLTYKGDGKASLEITPDLVTPQVGVDELAMNILEHYLEGGESLVRGEGPIRNSSLMGVSVIGEKNRETYEAWIYGPLAGGNTGNVLAFIINYQNDEQKNALYSILDTLEMLSEEIGSDEVITPDEG